MGETSKPVVSVIVPMYNVGECAEKCLDSLLSQTYCNIEIIIVDDGSTDCTEDICKAYSRKHSNINYIKKENGGLSSARNKGLCFSTGDYILYLDGDDRLKPNTIDVSVACAVAHRADLVVFGLKNINACERFRDDCVPEWEHVSSEQMLRKLFLLKGETGSACGKLFHKSLSPYLHFPEGQLFEDFGTIATTIASADSIYRSDAPLYGYVSRRGSITRVEEYTEAHISGMIASLTTAEAAASIFPSLSPDIKCFKLFCNLRLLGRLNIKEADEKYGGSFKVSEIRKEAFRTAFSPNISVLWRIRSLLFSASPSLYKKVYFLLKR